MTDVAPILGGLVCCIVPVISFLAGITVARYGSPLRVQWRGFKRRNEEEEEDA